MTWHVDTTLLSRYATGQLDPATAWSVETHVVDCRDCRDTAADAAADAAIVPASRVATIARGVHLHLDAPRPGPLERLLLAIGVRGHLARLLAATPSLTGSWLAGVALVLAAAAAATRWGWQPGDPTATVHVVFLTVASLVPLAGVALAFGPRVDPTYEIGLAAPMRSGRLLLVRTLAVVATSLALAAAATLFLPAWGWPLWAWIVPSLAVTTASLALATVRSPLWSTSVVASAWLTLVIVSQVVTTVQFDPYDSTGQLAAGVVLTVSLGSLWARRERLEVEVAS